MRINFQRVKFTAARYEMIDGKRKRRQRTFEQTINPWNKNASGFPKTRTEIHVELVATARAWQAEVKPTATADGGRDG